jgi:hypothetical protein
MLLHKYCVKIRFYNTLNNNDDDKTSTLLTNQKKNKRMEKKLEYKGKSCSSSKKERADI